MRRRITTTAFAALAIALASNCATAQEADQKVIVKGDTIDIIIPQKNYGRYDRGLNNYLFVPKGQWAFGVTAYYGEWDTDDVQFLDFLNDFNFTGSAFSIKPYISYFIGHNQAIGMKIGYTRNKFDIGNLTVNFEDDIDFTIEDVEYHTKNYSASFFYRYYIGLDKGHRFAIYSESELEFSLGDGYFKRIIDSEPRETRTSSSKLSINFGPGFCVFLHEKASFNISFGVFSIYYKEEDQRTNDTERGSRSTTGASFKFNVLNVSMGVALHI